MGRQRSGKGGQRKWHLGSHTNRAPSWSSPPAFCEGPPSSVPPRVFSIVLHVGDFKDKHSEEDTRKDTRAIVSLRGIWRRTPVHTGPGCRAALILLVIHDGITQNHIRTTFGEASEALSGFQVAHTFNDSGGGGRWLFVSSRPAQVT